MIPPSITNAQKVNTRNPRSTLGTSTEIYDYLRLLSARIGKTYSPVSGKEVTRHSQEDVVRYILSLSKEDYALVMAPFGWDDAQRRVEKLLALQQDGYARFFDGKEAVRVEDVLQRLAEYETIDLMLLTGRVEPEDTPDNKARILESVRSAFSVGDGAWFEIGRASCRERV